MKVLMINGSPHAEGCTFTALSEVAVGLSDYDVASEIYWIGNKPVPGCIACMRCKVTGKCIYDDGVNALNARMAEFDGFVFGSPVYYAGASGQICSFLDRLFYSGGQEERDGKPGASVVSCRRGGATAAFERLNMYFTIANMPVISSQYWNQVHGFTPDDVRRDEEGLQTMRTLGRNMGYELQALAAAREAGIKKPVREEPVHTNFIR